MTYGGGTPSSPVTLTYGYDSIGRPSSLTDLSGATGVGYGGRPGRRSTGRRMRNTILRGG